MFLPSSSSACMSVCSIDAWKWECIVYDTQARCWNSADQCSLHSLWCAGNSNYYFFNGRKMAVKTISEVHRHGNDLQIWLLHFSTDCAEKNATQTVHLWQKKKKKHSSLQKKKERKQKTRKCVGRSQSFCINAFVKWKSLWFWDYKNKRIRRCGSIVPASEISLVTLLFHYIPLCHHSEWLVLIMQMNQRKEAWVIITVVDRLWGVGGGGLFLCHRDSIRKKILTALQQ